MEKMEAQIAGSGLLRDEGERETYCEMRSTWRREDKFECGGMGAIVRCWEGVSGFATAGRVARWRAGKKVGDGSVFEELSCRLVG